jgi:hypothetical protein
VVAKRLDECCGQYEPVSVVALAADDCLVPYPATGVEPERASACLARNMLDCSAVRCGDFPPPSRSAQPVEDTDGECRFADECAGPEDCVLATDSQGSCCACPESILVPLLESSVCYLDSSSAVFGRRLACSRIPWAFRAP